MGAPDASLALGRAWAATGGDDEALGKVVFVGPDEVLPSVYPVTAAASGAVAAAALAGACLTAEAAGRTVDDVGTVVVDRAHAGIACRSERYLDAEQPLGIADPFGGDHRCADGWVRIHTLYPHHRDAALHTLGVPPERTRFVDAVHQWPGEELQEAVIAAGGAAARLRTVEEWHAHPHGRRTREVPVVDVSRLGDGAAGEAGTFRVLDLTRVIAGPTASKVLAAHGADVLRIEPPGFPELPLLTVDTGFGKRAAILDLHAVEHRQTFEELVRSADVVVHGFRPGAIDALGYDDEALCALRPGLVVASLSAWGAPGPWADRRGFDSLVQMASGIAVTGMAAYGSERPVPLPLQLLDHATAHLLALGVMQALRARRRAGGAWRVTAALARTAAWLEDLGPVDAREVAEPDMAMVDVYRDEMASHWGRLRFVRPAGVIGDVPLAWPGPPQPAGTSPPTWVSARRGRC